MTNGSFDSTPGERPESELLPQFGIEKPDDTEEDRDTVSGW